VDVVRTPELGVAGFEILAPGAGAAAIVAAARAAGAAPLDVASAEVLRVEAGRPRYGADFDETQLAQEVGFDRLGAISFSKGCYTGQETVARVHFRGHVNRTLRGLRARAPLVRGATLLGAGRATVGDVRSAAHSPVAGHIALAYVRREVGDGDTVTVDEASGALPATVVALPFALD
jgi:folate-binding protein YgfZ